MTDWIRELIAEECARAEAAEAAEVHRSAQVAPHEPTAQSGVIRWPHAGKPLPLNARFNFLVPGPFTRPMLERATKLWQLPLDAEDWRDIAAGKYLFANKEYALQQYLEQWADDHPRKMQRLIDEFFPENSRDKDRRGGWLEGGTNNHSRNRKLTGNKPETNQEQTKNKP